MFLNGVTKCFLFLTLIYFPLTEANHFRAAEGATVHLPCHSPPEDTVQSSVEWTKYTADKLQGIYRETIFKRNINHTAHVSNIANDLTRFTLTINNLTLRIENVRPSDSGNYTCKITRLIPPPSVDESSSLELQVAGVSLQQLNISNNDSCIDLRCSLEDLKTPEPANFTWSRGGQMLLHAATFNDTRSELSLCKPDWSDGDTITCHVDYSGSKTQKSVKLDSQHPPDKAHADMLLIIAGSATAGLIFCIVLIVVVCKCRKQDENGSIVFSNKVYENFSFAMSRQNTQSNPKPQTEECIYEN